MGKEKRAFFWQKLHSCYHRFPFLRSLRLRIFLIVFVLGVMPCLAMRGVILSNYETRVVNIRTSEVQTQLRILANHLLTYEYLRNPSSSIVDAELEQFSSFYDGRVLVIDGSLRVVKDTYDMSTGKTVVSGDVVRCLQNGSRAITGRYVKNDRYLEVIVPISETKALENMDFSGNGSSSEEVSGVLLASVSTDSIAATLEVLGRRANLLMLFMSVVAFSVAVLAAAFLVRPFEKLTKAIQDVRAGYTASSVQVNDYLETENIVHAFNDVIARMRVLDESRQEFVSNVSHELKTPMTSMKVLADSLLQMGDDVPPEMYREFLQDIDGELDRENQMIEELLSLARTDRKQVSMNISQLDINALAESVLKRVRPLAQKKDVELILVSEREIRAEADEVKMVMILTNLVENAVKYNREHGKVTVTLDSDGKSFTIAVTDTGIGIPKEAQAKIFDRFFRVDPSRSREIGGTGLGLSIVRSAVLLHRGTIRVESEEGAGSTFTVSIPLNYIENPDVEETVLVPTRIPEDQDVTEKTEHVG